MQVDLPAFERPTNAISGTSRAGKKCNWGAVVRNLAVCSQPSAMVASDFSAGLCAGPGRETGGWFVLVVIKFDGGPEPAL